MAKMYDTRHIRSPEKFRGWSYTVTDQGGLRVQYLRPFFLVILILRDKKYPILYLEVREVLTLLL